MNDRFGQFVKLSQDHFCDILTVPYTLHLDDGDDGLPVFFHLHFEFSSQHSQLQRQFTPKRAAISSIHDYTTWLTEHGDSILAGREKGGLEHQLKQARARAQKQLVGGDWV